MSSRSEFEKQLHLAQEPSPEGVTVAVDKLGNFYLGGYGGMGTRLWSKLEVTHPYVPFIKELIEEARLIQNDYEYMYDAGGIDLAQCEFRA
jgi:hypothetical protein